MIPQAEVARQRALLDAHALEDRAPAMPPFVLGDRVRYLGPAVEELKVGMGVRATGPNGEPIRGPAGIRHDALSHGAVCVVILVMRGRRGDLVQVTDDEGKKLWWDVARTIPILDTTIDGACCVSVNGKRLRGHTITAATAAQWEAVR